MLYAIRVLCGQIAQTKLVSRIEARFFLVILDILIYENASAKSGPSRVLAYTYCMLTYKNSFLFTFDTNWRRFMTLDISKKTEFNTIIYR